MNTKNLLFAIVAILMLAFSACNQGNSSNASVTIKTEADSVSSALGYSIGENMSKQFGELKSEVIANGLIDAFNGVKNPLFETPQTADMAIRTYLRNKNESALDSTIIEEPKAEKNAKIENEADSIAFALGFSIGENMKKQFANLNPRITANGLMDAFNGKEMPLYENLQEADLAIRTYMRKESELAAQKNLKAGEEFLAKNAKRSKVLVTESGLQYEVLVEGDGEKPTAASTVEVHYHGTTIDGVVFDSSVDRGETIQFPLNGVIAGWTEGLQLMTVGSKYKFYIPSDLAYGPRGAGGAIGPNSALIFEVELFDIVQ